MRQRGLQQGPHRRRRECTVRGWTSVLCFLSICAVVEPAVGKVELTGEPHHWRFEPVPTSLVVCARDSNNCMKYHLGNNIAHGRLIGCLSSLFPHFSLLLLSICRQINIALLGAPDFGYHSSLLRWHRRVPTVMYNICHRQSKHIRDRNDFSSSFCSFTSC